MKNALCLLIVLALAVSACAGTTTATKTPKISHIRAARLPFKIIGTKSGRDIAVAALYAKLATAQAICIGEVHPDPHHHWAQLVLFDRLSKQNVTNKTTTALGLEMFQRPFQGILDDYRAGKISEQELLSRTAWKKRWGYDYRLYRPMINIAVKRGLTLLALNTARELIKQISRRGLDMMSAKDKAKLPQLDLHDKEHRAWWNKLMNNIGDDDDDDGGGHANPHKHSANKKHQSKMPRAERIYTAQVTWDETMAATATKWLRGGQHRQIIILAGTGHCHNSAIIRRMKRRGIERVVSIRPIVDAGDGEVGELIAAPVNDYMFVMTRAR